MHRAGYWDLRSDLLVASERETEEVVASESIHAVDKRIFYAFRVYML